MVPLFRHTWICFIILFMGSASSLLLGSYPANDISLAQSFPQEKLRDMLTPTHQWQPFPKASDRQAWEQVPHIVRQTIIKKAEAAAEQPVAVLPASVYLQYQRNGNRTNYQTIWKERRFKLNTLVVAECLENQGRFLDPITDLVWALCEETSWTYPAHIWPQQAGVGLPDADDQVVALFSAQTSNSLTLTRYLLADQLDTVSPLICKRIQSEIDRRILTPFLTKEFNWMGYEDRRNKSYPNNWNPWICSNIMITALLCEDNETRKVQIVHKLLDCLDNFLTYYPADGSCDEGPSYWGHAGASLLDSLEHLYSATRQRLNVYDHPLIQEMGRFIYRAHIADDYFICLGDCDPRFSIANERVFCYGKRIGDKHLQAMGAYGITRATFHELVGDSINSERDLNRFLHLLFNGNDMVTFRAQSHPMIRDMWLGHPNMQMMSARDQAGSTKGLFVAAWGGHNDQSHNHNDVGNFVIFANGKPMVIDIGRPTYRRQTFSSRRYEIWTFQSGFHNLPTINGVDQKAGRSYEAREVTCQRSHAGATLKMNIAPAYPQTAGVTSWERTVHLNRGENVEVTDAFNLQKASRNIIENFIVAGLVEEKPGVLILHDRERSIHLRCDYDAQKLSTEVEPILLKDAKLKAAWGDTIYRIRMKTKQQKKQDQLTFRFSIQ